LKLPLKIISSEFLEIKVESLGFVTGNFLT